MIRLYTLILDDLLSRRAEEGDLSQELEAVYATALTDVRAAMSEDQQAEIEKLYSSSSRLPEDVRKIVDKVLQRKKQA